jgi:hypothetical protein
MRKVILHVIVLLLVGLLVGLALAQDDRGDPNDPETNERANACFAGGSWEGKCHQTDTDFDGDVDEHDINWMWRCGWYRIRAEKGLLKEGDYPSECYERPVLLGASSVGCPSIETFNVPDVGTSPTPAIVDALATTIYDILVFSQSRGLGWNGTLLDLIDLANTYYLSPVTLIDPNPFDMINPRASGITYTITADIGFDGCYDIVVIVTSDTINFVESNLAALIPD